MITSSSSLLAHVALGLSSGPEDLATEALRFVLARSPAARTAFEDHLAQRLGLSRGAIGAQSYHTQASDGDGTRPDLVGLDANRKPVVYVESKFWAGLTEAQPVGYLQRIRREGARGLVFLAPADRLVTLAAELERRCIEAGMQPSDRDASSPSRLSFIGQPALALTSWSDMLTALLQAVTVAGGNAAAEDLRQLQGLCRQMSVAGFQPLRSEELTGRVAQRIEDYCGLADDLTTRLVADGLASTDGLRSASGRDIYCRYAMLQKDGQAQAAAQIAFHSGWWARLHPTPLWISLKGPDWQPSAAIQQAMHAWSTAEPPRAFVTDSGKVLVPLFLPTGREREPVLESLVEQSKAICARLP